MRELLEKIRADAKAQLSDNDADIEALRVRYLGKKGELTAVLRGMGKLSAEERPLIGQLANEVRADIEAAIEERRQEMQERLLELKLKKEKMISQELSIHRSFSEIPIECFVNAITDKNIVLIGGNMMYEALNGYGFKNLRFKPAQSRDTTYQDISDTDLVIISTAYSDHATTETATGIIRKHNIPFMYFNNKSAEMLVHEIFKKFYSE